MQLQLHSSAGTSQQICALTSIGIGICMKSFCGKRCILLLKQELLAQAVQALEALFTKFQNLQQKQCGFGMLPFSQPKTVLDGWPGSQSVFALTDHAAGFAPSPSGRGRG